MSLINDALKKAQREREGSSTGPSATMASGASQGLSVSPIGQPVASGKNNVALIIAGAAVIIAISVAATVYLLRNDRRQDPRTTTTASSPTGTPSSSTGTAAGVTPTPTGIGPPTPEPKSNGAANTAAPLLSPLAAPPAAAVASSSLPPSTTPAAAQTAPASANAGAALPPPVPLVVAPETTQLKATYRVQGLIDKFKISGIRLADTDSKVLLNDHLFRINDLVEPSLGLRLTAIESHLLTFTDADGNSYLKHF